MKLKLYLMALLMGAFILQSCGDDDVAPKDVPAGVQEAFARKYPGLTAYEWEMQTGYYVADFRNGNREAEAWFRPDGAWVKTETDYVGQLPEPVQNHIITNYPAYRVDDVDWVETPTDEYFDIELDKEGSRDVYLKIRANGELCN